jgi:GcrA cell cycle regulator
MARLISGSWTEADNERLKALVAQGASIVRAAAAFNRSLISVRNQARKLGTPFPPMRAFRKKLTGDPSSSWRQY